MNSAIYVIWDEPQSDKPPGWYHVVVSEYHSDGETTIEYANNATEQVNLNAVEGKHTRGIQYHLFGTFRQGLKYLFFNTVYSDSGCI